MASSQGIVEVVAAILDLHALQELKPGVPPLAAAEGPGAIDRLQICPGERGIGGLPLRIRIQRGIASRDDGTGRSFSPPLDVFEQLLPHSHNCLQGSEPLVETIYLATLRDSSHRPPF